MTFVLSAKIKGETHKKVFAVLAIVAIFGSDSFERTVEPLESGIPLRMECPYVFSDLS